MTSGTTAGLGARAFGAIGFMAAAGFVAAAGFMAAAGFLAAGFFAATALRAAFLAGRRADFFAAARLVAPVRLRPRVVLLGFFEVFLRFAIPHPSDR